ncbi:hypothetical protein JMA_40350 (plasmid) [Jeotgalibacillus malaysiensis]|uniref:Uncharacterized protein n=1 Tax=Jeotgalibacillus malaysiensis TaxID=1508404 RepID=A0A0B5AXU2_9BACL|nr:hypothetical protein [Jeotgalibacillus malaysiensis]AJD93353.1 hypothetical protein JMA_40350 [Jeotgalibacillus malaysiensis]
MGKTYANLKEKLMAVPGSKEFMASKEVVEFKETYRKAKEEAVQKEKESIDSL